jgi:hypothetical protein
LKNNQLKIKERDENLYGPGKLYVLFIFWDPEFPRVKRPMYLL